MIKRIFIFIILMTGSIIYGANFPYQISTADGVHVRTIEGAIQYAQGKTLDSESGDFQKAKKFYTEANFINLARDDILKGLCRGLVSKENMYGAYLALQGFCGPPHLFTNNSEPFVKRRIYAAK